MTKKYRIAVIGSTGRGNYGHGLDTAFLGLENAEVIAVADDNAEGLQRAGERLDVKQLYADYRQMLAREKPDIVCVCPQWVTDRVAMVTAASEAGAHIYCEKPVAGDLKSIDAMLAACRKADVKLAMAHQWRAMPPIQLAIRELREGKYGRVLRVHARPKDDSRGGGEELNLHGTHLFDMLIAIAGPPRWVSGHVSSGGRDAEPGELRKTTQPIGPAAGDSISAMIGFDGGTRGYFDSTANLYRGRGKSSFDVLFGLYLECERAALQFRQPGDVYVYPAPLVMADDEKLAWEKKWIEDWHFTPEHQPRPIRREWLHLGNKTLARDLIEAIEQNRQPLSSLEDVRYVMEIVQGVYASHFQDGRRIAIPLEDRVHSLAAESSQEQRH